MIFKKETKSADDLFARRLHPCYPAAAAGELELIFPAEISSMVSSTVYVFLLHRY